MLAPKSLYCLWLGMSVFCMMPLFAQPSRPADTLEILHKRLHTLFLHQTPAADTVQALLSISLRIAKQRADLNALAVQSFLAGRWAEIQQRPRDAERQWLRWQDYRYQQAKPQAICVTHHKLVGFYIHQDEAKKAQAQLRRMIDYAFTKPEILPWVIDHLHSQQWWYRLAAKEAQTPSQKQRYTRALEIYLAQSIALTKKISSAMTLLPQFEILQGSNYLSVDYLLGYYREHQYLDQHDALLAAYFDKPHKSSRQQDKLYIHYRAAFYATYQSNPKRACGYLHKMIESKSYWTEVAAAMLPIRPDLATYPKWLPICDCMEDIISPKSSPSLHQNLYLFYRAVGEQLAQTRGFAAAEPYYLKALAKARVFADSAGIYFWERKVILFYQSHNKEDEAGKIAKTQLKRFRSPKAKCEVLLALYAGSKAPQVRLDALLQAYRIAHKAQDATQIQRLIAALNTWVTTHCISTLSPVARRQNIQRLRQAALWFDADLKVWYRPTIKILENWAK